MSPGKKDLKKWQQAADFTYTKFTYVLIFLKNFPLKKFVIVIIRLSIPRFEFFFYYIIWNTPKISCSTELNRLVFSCQSWLSLFKYILIVFVMYRILSHLWSTCLPFLEGRKPGRKFSVVLESLWKRDNIALWNFTVLRKYFSCSTVKDTQADISNQQ